MVGSLHGHLNTPEEVVKHVLSKAFRSLILSYLSFHNIIAVSLIIIAPYKASILSTALSAMIMVPNAGFVVKGAEIDASTT